MLCLLAVLCAVKVLYGLLYYAGWHICGSVGFLQWTLADNQPLNFKRLHLKCFASVEVSKPVLMVSMLADHLGER